MSGPRNESADDLVTRAVTATRRLPLPTGPTAAIQEQTLAALREAASQPQAALLQRINHMTWKSKASAVLAMAASVLAVYVGLSTFTGGFAFADVVKALNGVRSATWKTTTEVELPNKQTVKTSGVGKFLAPSHERMEFTFQGADGIQIVDGEKHRMLALDPASKTAIFLDVKNIPAGRESPFGKTFQGLRELVARAHDDQDGKVERLGVETIDGRRAEGFRLELGSVEVKIWADPQTLLPVRVEQRPTEGPESQTVMSDFQVDVDLDESLFSLEMPEGYTLQQTAELDLSKDPIYYVAETLKLAADLNGGVFPPTLRGEDGMDGILLRSPEKTAEVFAEKAGQDSPEERRKQAMQLSMQIGAAFGMLGALSHEQNDWHYAGKDVKLNAPDRPIFWFKRHQADTTYKVLYADLSVKEVPAGEAPKAPSAEDTSKP
jgi:outer membrane lipoprotein-sorting protein